MELKEDRPAWVQFEVRPMEDRAASEAAGHYVAKNVDFALVTPPYSKDCVEIEVTAWLRQNRENAMAGRMPKEWADQYEKNYKAWKEGNEIPEFGTPIKGWPVISPAQQNNLITIGVRTVEDLAQMNDEGVSRFGMGAVDLRNKAQAWLNAAKDTGKAAIETANLKAQMSALQSNLDVMNERFKSAGTADVESLQKTNKELAEKLSNMEKEIVELRANQKQKPGRKPK